MTQNRDFWSGVVGRIDEFGLGGAEKRSILRQIASLRAEDGEVERFRRRVSRAAAAEAAKALKSVEKASYDPSVPTGRHRKDQRKYKGRLRGHGGWMKDPRSYGPCPFGCKTPLPHTTKEALFSHYCRMVGRIGAAKARARIYARGPEYQRWAARIGQAEPAIKRRVAVFYETAPRVAATLGEAGVRRIVETYPPDFWIEKFRRWVEIHYAGSAPKHGVTRTYEPGSKPAVEHVRRPGRPPTSGKRSTILGTNPYRTLRAVYKDGVGPTLPRRTRPPPRRRQAKTLDTNGS